MTAARSPFVIWHPPTDLVPDYFPMAFPEDTSLEDVVKCAVAYGDGCRVVREEAGGEDVLLGEVREGAFDEVK